MCLDALGVGSFYWYDEFGISIYQFSQGIRTRFRGSVILKYIIMYYADYLARLEYLIFFYHNVRLTESASILHSFLSYNFPCYKIYIKTYITLHFFFFFNILV